MIGMPHTVPTVDYTWCAYTTKIMHMIMMLEMRGHEVFVYAGPNFSRFIGPPGPDNQNQGVDYNYNLPLWTEMADKVVQAALPIVQDGDFIMMISSSQYPIFKQLKLMSNKKLIDVEYGVGYSFTKATFCIYESSPHMHATLVSMLSKGSGGRLGGGDTDGKFYHFVAPNYYDTEYLNPYPQITEDSQQWMNNVTHGGQPYVFFIGRLIFRKGVSIAIDTAALSGYQIIIAGEGTDKQRFVDHAEKIGVRATFVGGVNPVQRQHLFKNAICTLVPTLYLGPFEGVHAESMLCGTPVVTSPFGVFNETVIDGFNGYQCHDLGEFGGAVLECAKMDVAHRINISQHAAKRFSIHCTEPGAVGEIYENIWNRLAACSMGIGFSDTPVRPPGTQIPLVFKAKRTQREDDNQ